MLMFHVKHLVWLYQICDIPLIKWSLGLVLTLENSRGPCDKEGPRTHIFTNFGEFSEWIMSQNVSRETVSLAKPNSRNAFRQKNWDERSLGSLLTSGLHGDSAFFDNIHRVIDRIVENSNIFNNKLYISITIKYI